MDSISKNEDRGQGAPDAEYQEYLEPLQLKKRQKSKLDAYAETLWRMDQEKETLAKMREWLKTEGVEATLGLIGKYLEKMRVEQWEANLCTKFRTSSKLHTKVKALFKKNPAPELKTIVKVYQTIIWDLTTNGEPASASLELANRLTNTVIKYMDLQGRTKLKRRAMTLAERKAEDSRKADGTRALEFCLEETKDFPEAQELLRKGFDELRKKTTSTSTASGIVKTADDSKTFGVQIPNRTSFADFLLHEARVPCGQGQHGPYSFAGREALLAVVNVIDTIFGNSSAEGRDGTPLSSDGAQGTARPTNALPDAELSLAGGAQFGKTILELNLAAYCTSQLFRNFGLYLPDDDLVEGIVDSKFRPDVVDQIPWFADMTRVGKALNRSGKTVNRKGAFLVTDGRRKAVGMIRGLGKVPTTFSMDMAMMDEVDDIEPRMMKFVRGRLTASDLRFIMKIGTQRIHGRGMNKAWKDGSQGVFIFKCPGCGHEQNAEEEFPGIIRLRIAECQLRNGGTEASPLSQSLSPKGSREAGKIQSGLTSDATPKLTWAGDFKVEGSDEVMAAHKPGNHYYLACVKCGAELDRSKPIEHHRQPEQIKQRHWSFRISQLAIGAIDLEQIVTRFQLAVTDPQEMIVFRCDVLGLPQSTAQVLTPAIIERARAVTVFDLKPRVSDGCIGVAGLDMGDRCWLWARERQAAAGNNGHEVNRLLAAEKMSAGDVVGRTIALFKRMGLSALFIDERPLVNEARTIALALNGLQDLAQWPRVPDARDAYLTLPGGLTWDGKNSRWLNLKCAVVRFTRNKLGAGIQQSIVFFEEGGQTKFVPCIECNRFETIDRVVREFLTPQEGVVEIIQGSTESRPTTRETPMMLLPRMGAGHPPILDIVEAHLIAGSERVKAVDGSQGDYVDACENHFLLADGYSKLAEIVCTGNRPMRFAYEKVEQKSGGELMRRGKGGLL